MLRMVFCAVATAVSAELKVVWMVQSSVVSGRVRSSSCLKMVAFGQAMPVSGKLSRGTNA